jgi:drug/metabolite transporter (DMT)-like permease
VRPPIAALTAASLACFAANSLLARRALGGGAIDPATFTAVRLGAGALVLPLLALAGGRRPAGGGWGPALALFLYAGAFSLAYLRIHAGPGALLLFAAVQATMLGWSVLRGERPTAVQWTGAALALGGLAYLTLPGARGGVDPSGALLMLAAGAGWGAYSLRGRSARDPLATTAANFLRAAILAGPLALLLLPRAHATSAGLALAAASGALASGVGYSLWYAAVPALGPTRAATVQLAVPVLTALVAAGLLGERVTARLALSAAAILGGVALSLRRGAAPVKDAPAAPAPAAPRPARP